MALSGKGTDDIIEAFINEGLSLREAIDSAKSYVLKDSNFLKSPKEFLEDEGILFEFEEPAEESEEEYKPKRKTYKVDWTSFINNINKYNKKLNKKKGKNRVGCSFGGCKEVKEINNDKFFIPSSYYCGLKCLAEFFKVDFKTINTKGHNPFAITTNKIYESVEKLFKKKLDQAPSLVKMYNVGKDIKLKTINDKAINKVGCCIVLVPFRNTEYHAVLCKTDSMSSINVKQLVESLVIEENLILSDETLMLNQPIIRNPLNQFYVYDIETSSKINKRVIDGVEREERYQIPEGLAFMKIDIHKPFNYLKRESIVVYKGEDCIKKMLNYISKTDLSEEIQIFAHNGGAFDNIFVKSVKGVELISEFKSGMSIKQIELKYNEKRFLFKDSCAFMQAPLKDCSKYFKINEHKTEFDIANKSHDWFKTNTEWVPYLIQDVLVLGMVCYKFESSLLKLGESTTLTCSIASVAWKVMMKTCYGLTRTHIFKNPVSQRFIRDSCYGGRLLHYRKYFEKDVTLINGKTSRGLVSLDGNSLYPSAMFKGMYPIGKPHVMTDNQCSPFILRKFLEDGIMFIAEVELDAGNIRYPLLPYKTEEGNLIYRAGKFTGVYNSVDLREAMNDGYELKKVLRGIFWYESSRIYYNCIEFMYNERLKLKKEDNPMEYVIKIIVNSMYGKNLEMIDNETIFTKEEEIKDKISTSELLKNGQYQHNVNLLNPIYRKPLHLGSFILSYARKIMNNFIRKIGVENVFYSDTDSVYVPIESVEKSGIEMNDVICGLKNDYGDGMLIEKALFLDLKRYYLAFNKPDKKGNSFKCKFNGINFKNKGCLRDWHYDEKNKDDMYKFYKWFYDNPKKLADHKVVQEKWTKTKLDVIISEVDMIFQINPDQRSEWIIDVSYPLFYDHSKAPRGLGRETEWSKSIKCDFTVSRFGLKSNLPLTTNKISKIQTYKPVENVEFETSFIINSKGKVFMRRKNYKGEYECFTINKMGPNNRIDEKDIGVYKNLLFMPNDDKTVYPKLDDEEFDKLCGSIKEIIKGKVDESHDRKLIE